MERMSAKPADFKKETAVDQNLRDTVVLEDTVPSKDTVSSKTTVSSDDGVPSPGASLGNGMAGVRVYRCITVQDGHSFAEDRLYNALWHYRHSKAETENSRLVSIGWDRMAQAAGMTPKNAKRNCLSLIKKLAIEKVKGHNSEQRVGTTYRVFSYTAIVKRRKEAGLEYIVRNRGGVTFVPAPESTKDTVSSEGTVSTEGTDSLSTQDTDTVVTEGSPLSQIEVKESQREQPSSSSVAVVADAVRPYLRLIDDNAVKIVLAQIRITEPEYSVNEVVHIGTMVAAKIAGQENVSNPVGLWIKQVPKLFPSAELKVFRAAEKGQTTVVNTLSHYNQTAEVEGQEWAAISERHHTKSGYDMQAIAKDPQLNDKGRRIAGEIMKRLGRYTPNGL